MMMFSLACLWSSFTHDLALSNDDLNRWSVGSASELKRRAYGLSDIVDNDGAVGVAVIHGGQRLVSLLASGVPYFELDGRVFVE